MRRPKEMVATVAAAVELNPMSKRNVAVWPLVVLLTSGCAALEQRETRAWLALHAIDSAQTFRIAQNPDCYSEGHPLTSEILGENPSRRAVVAWSLGSAAAHLAITEWLLRSDHPRLARAFQYVRLADTAYSVGHNHAIGIRIGSPNRPPSSWCRR